MAASISSASSACCKISSISSSSLALSSPSSQRASVSTAFGLRCGRARVSCSSVEEDVKAFVKSCSDAGKMATVALAASALAVSGASAEGTPPRLSYDEIQGQTYLEVKGSGTANQCPVLKTGDSGAAKIKAGDYQVKNFCLEPTSFTVKSEGIFKGTGDEYQRTKLMTRLTYTLDAIEGDLKVGADGSIKFVEKDGIDYAAVTVQLPGGERVPFLFTIKELVAQGKSDGFSGTFLVPSYRGSSFLDPKGRGGSTGYDNAVALPAGGRGDEEELQKENQKNTAALKGNITFKLAKADSETGEIAGVFESIQPSDTDLGSKAPKDVKIEGIWYGQIE